MDLSNWKGAPRPERVPLEGRYVHLEPLDPARHGDALFVSAQADGAESRFRYLFEDAPADRIAFDAWIAKAAAGTDPFFYAVAIPAVLLLGISKSGFGAGFGSLAVPMMALAVTVPQAAAILMPVLLVMDVLGMAAFRKDFDLALLRFILPFGVLGIIVGALLFKLLNAHTVAAIVGIFTLLFL